MEDLKALLDNVRILEGKGQVDGTTYRKLGVKFFSEGDYERAKEFFSKAYSTSHDLVALSNLGVIVGKYFKDYNQAEKIFEEVIRQNDKLPLAFYNCACNYVRMKKYPEAIANLARALSLGGKEYLSLAETDSAFEEIAQQEEFKKLVPHYRQTSNEAN